MPSSGVPLKYQYRPLETLIELKTPICNVLDNDLDYEPIIATSLNIPEARLIITYCENCNKCVEKLPAVTKFFTKFASRGNTPGGSEMSLFQTPQAYNPCLSSCMVHGIEYQLITTPLLGSSKWARSPV